MGGLESPDCVLSGARRCRDAGGGGGGGGVKRAAGKKQGLGFF